MASRPRATALASILSMHHDPNRRAGDIVDTSAPRKHKILDLEKIEAIQDLLTHHPDYIYISTREDTNRQAAIERHALLRDPTFLLNATIALLGILAVPALTNFSTDLEKKVWQYNNNSTASFEHERNISAI